MEKMDHVTYFEQIAYPTIRELLSQGEPREAQEGEAGKSQIFAPFNLEIVNK
jgi:hypothetical protein